MKKTIKSLAVLLLAGSLVLTGCSSKKDGEEGNVKQKLVISTWGLNEELVREDDIKVFEEMYDCEIVLDIGTTAERYTKFSTNHNSDIDLILLSQSAAANAIDAGLVEKLDYSKISNYENLIPGAQAVADLGYGPAYTINSIGIIYNPDELGFEITEWADLWRPELKGRISIPDITTTFGPAMVHVASDYAGVDITSDDGEAAFAALEELKPNIVKTYAKSSDLANMFATGEIAVAVVGDFAISIIQGALETAEFIVPESGTYANFNTIDINTKSENKDLAYKYIDYRLSQELQTRNATSELNEAPTNKNVILTKEQATNKTYGEVAENAKAIDYTFVNPILETWIDNWNRLLNS